MEGYLEQELKRSNDMLVRIPAMLLGWRRTLEEAMAPVIETGETLKGINSIRGYDNLTNETPVIEEIKLGREAVASIRGYLEELTEADETIMEGMVDLTKRAYPAIERCRVSLERTDIKASPIAGEYGANIKKAADAIKEWEEHLRRNAKTIKEYKVEAYRALAGLREMGLVKEDINDLFADIKKDLERD